MPKKKLSLAEIVQGGPRLAKGFKFRRARLAPRQKTRIELVIAPSLTQTVETEEINGKQAVTELLYKLSRGKVRSTIDGKPHLDTEIWQWIVKNKKFIKNQIREEKANEQGRAARRD